MYELQKLILSMYFKLVLMLCAPLFFNVRRFDFICTLLAFAASSLKFNFTL